MNEALRIVREHDPVERVFVSGKVGEVVIDRSGNRHRPLLATPLKANDDVLLQHFVILESFGA